MTLRQWITLTWPQLKLLPDSPQIKTDSTPNKVDSALDSNLADSEVQATNTEFSPANMRPQHLRQPPMMLSYHNLGNPIDMQAGINAVGNCFSFWGKFLYHLF